MKHTVYIINQNPTLVSTLAERLSQHGYTINTSRTAEAFLSCYSPDSQACECFVIDTQLPMMSGLSLLDRLASMEFVPPIIMTSSFLDARLAVRVMRRGAFDYVEHNQLLTSAVELVQTALDESGSRWEQYQEHRAFENSMLSLSRREKEVVNLLMEGDSIKQIAHRLEISFQTVAKHRASAMQKLHAASMHQLLLLYAQSAVVKRSRHPMEVLLRN
ncbi:response regulator transcription factor [Lacunimicrobium album]